MKTSLIVRRKHDPHAPLITATPETVDLDMFDVVDEHGTPVSDERLAEIRKMQSPAVEQEPGKQPAAQHVPQHETQRHEQPKHESHATGHEPPSKSKK